MAGISGSAIRPGVTPGSTSMPVASSIVAPGLGGAWSVTVAPDGALTLTATVRGLPAYDGSNGMEGIVAT